MAWLNSNCRGGARRWVALMGGALLAVMATASLQAADQREVQAVFLLNLSRFIRWPETAFAAADSPLVIGSLPGNRVSLVLREAAEGELSGRHPIVVREIRSDEDLAGCHIVHFSKSEVAKGARFVAMLKEKPVLIVSDADGVLRLGGHVELQNKSGRFRLRLDPENLKASGLTASAQLLRVAGILER